MHTLISSYFGVCAGGLRVRQPLLMRATAFRFMCKSHIV
jgi:hypothetical protein